MAARLGSGQSRPPLRRMGQTHRLALQEAIHGEWSLQAARRLQHGRTDG
jgi:hypothetical protein